MLEQINKQTFETTMKENDVVLVDFYANWCGPCQVLIPQLEKIAEEFDGKAKIVKVNVDQDPELSGQFGVRSIPALFYFKNGELVGRQTGVQSHSVITDSLNQLIAATPVS
jgi:thioredoxin 1